MDIKKIKTSATSIFAHTFKFQSLPCNPINIGCQFTHPVRGLVHRVQNHTEYKPFTRMKAVNSANTPSVYNYIGIL